MLQTIRDHLHGWFAALLFGLLIIVFVFWGISGYTEMGGKTYAAKVNGEKISLEEVRDAVRNRMAMFERMAPDGLTPQQEARIRSDVLDAFVQREVLSQRASKQGYRVSDEALIAAIHEIPQFQAEGRFDWGTYERMLALQGYSTTAFEDSMRRDLIVQQLENGVMRSSFATPEELRRRIELEDEQREVAYAVFPAAAHAAEVTIADADVQARYEMRKAEYVTPETISIEYLELRADQLGSETQVSETEVGELYEAELASGRFQKPEERQARHLLLKLEGEDEAAVRTKAESLLARARAGEDFATLARENSQDESTAKEGGELGWVTRDMMVAPFSDALFEMQPGTFSEPVKTDFGLHIIQLEGVRGGEVQTFEEVRDSLTQELKQRRADSLFYDRAEQLGQLAFENRDSLEPVAQATGLQVQRVEGVTRQGGDGIAAEANVRAAAFGENVLENGENSDVIDLGEGRAVVLRVADRKPEAQRPLEEVRTEIEAQLREEGGKARAEAIATEVLSRLGEGATLEQLATEKAGEFHAAGFVGRKAGPPELTRAVFAAPKPDGGAPHLGQVALANGDRAVFVISAVKVGSSPTATVEQRQARARQVAGQRGNADLAAYVAQLQEKASVVKSQEQLAAIEE